MAVACFLTGESEPRDVSSVEDLDRLLDLTAERSNDAVGHTATFMSDDTDNRFVVGAGRKLVPVFHDDDRPESDVLPYMRSLGDITGPEGEQTEQWIIGNSWDDIARNTLIPEADAREAAREWFRTGNRPTNIRWQV